MSALDYLLSASDPFALFGFGRTFDVPPADLEQRYAALAQQAEALAKADADKGARVLAALRDGRALLADPVTRGRRLLDLLGGGADRPAGGLPAEFRRASEAGARAGPADWQAAERRRLLATASHLFRQLASADNGVVQRERRRQIRENLNAVEQIDRGVAPPP